MNFEMVNLDDRSLVNRMLLLSEEKGVRETEGYNTENLKNQIKLGQDELVKRLKKNKEEDVDN